MDYAGIAVIGPQAVYPSLLTGNYANYPDKGCVTPMQGLREGLGEKTNPQCTVSDGVFYNGSYYTTKAYDITECCRECYEDSLCEYWSYLGTICYMNTKDSSKSNVKGATSGQCTNNPTTSKVQNRLGCHSVGCGATVGFSDALDLINTMQKNGKLTAIVVLLGLDQSHESEGHDRTTIELPGHQNDLVSTIANNTATKSVPIVCILIHGGTLALGSAATECDAIIDAWYPGQMGGYAMADVIYGVKNPAGRAGVTSYLSTSQLPKPGMVLLFFVCVLITWDGDNECLFCMKGEMNEYAGNGVTYRYFKGEVLYPFGYGLSYTTFKYSNLKTNVTSAKGCDVIKVTVTVTNTGSMSGDEVVQLYVNQTMSATVPVPQIRLADFERIKDLGAGKSQDVDLILTPRYHSVVYNKTSPSYFEPDVNIEKGEFMIYVGGGQPKYFQGAVSQSITITDAAKLTDCENQD